MVCGDGKCETGETKTSCPADCGTPYECGNGLCEPGENSVNCLLDCDPSGLPTEGMECVETAPELWECAPGYECFTVSYEQTTFRHCYLAGCQSPADCGDSLINDSPIAQADYFTKEKTVCFNPEGNTDGGLCAGYSPMFFANEGMQCTASMLGGSYDPMDYICHDCGPLSMCLSDEDFDSSMWEQTWPPYLSQLKCRRICEQDSDCTQGKCLLIEDLTTDMYSCVLAPKGFCCLPGDQAPGCQ